MFKCEIFGESDVGVYAMHTVRDCVGVWVQIWIKKSGVGVISWLSQQHQLRAITILTKIHIVSSSRSQYFELILTS